MRFTGRAAVMYACAILFFLLSIWIAKETWHDYRLNRAWNSALEEWSRGEDDWPAAAAMLDELIMDVPEEPSAYELRCLILLKTPDRLLETRQVLDILLEKWPDRPSGWLAKGTLELDQGDVESAREAFTKAARQTELGEPQIALALLALEQGDLDGAGKLVDKGREAGLGLDGSLAEALVSSRLAEARGAYGDAIQHFLRAYAFAPQRAELLGPGLGALLTRSLLEDSGVPDSTLRARVDACLKLLEDHDSALGLNKNRWYLGAERWRILSAVSLAETRLKNWKAAAEAAEEAAEEMGKEIPELFLNQGHAWAQAAFNLPDDPEVERLARSSAQAFRDAAEELLEREPLPVEPLKLAFGNAAIMRVHAQEAKTAIRVCRDFSKVLADDMDVRLYLIQAVCYDHNSHQYDDEAIECYRLADDLGIEDEKVRLLVRARIRQLE